MKLNTVNGVTVVANLVYRNAGHGIHTDIGSTNVLVAGNVVLSNDGYGIGHEIGGSAVIQNNDVVDNGWETSEPGINILDSHDVVVSANQVTDNYRGIMLRQDDRSSISRLGNVVVSANTVTLADETRTGVGNLQASIGSVTFSANRYIVPSSLSRPFTYDSTTYDWDGWRGLGFDQNSTFESR